MNGWHSTLLIIAALVAIVYWNRTPTQISNPQTVQQSANECSKACARNYQLMDRFSTSGECVCRPK